MAEWVKFYGSEEQLKMMSESKNGWIWRDNLGKTQRGICSGTPFGTSVFNKIDSFLICEPHPHAEMIHRWADTGQPVYKFSEYDNEWQLISEPHWHRGIKYSFNPPKEKKFIEVRDYLYEAWAGDFRKRTAHKKFYDIEDPESAEGFIRWLDDGWRKVEI